MFVSIASIFSSFIFNETSQIFIYGKYSGEFTSLILIIAIPIFIGISILKI